MARREAPAKPTAITPAQTPAGGSVGVNDPLALAEEHVRGAGAVDKQ